MWRLLLVAVSLPLVALLVLILRSHRGTVQPEDLPRLIDRTDKLVVFQEPRDGSVVLFESADRRDLDTLKAALRVERPEKYVHCVCNGSPAIIFYSNGEKIGEVTNHHAKLLRCSLWESDAPIADREAFLKWFDDRNIPGPRKEYEDGLRRAKESEEQDRKWVEAMPLSLRPHWSAMRQYRVADLTPLRNALAEQIPETSARILALYSWYGSGAGRWSGYPGHEDIAEKMLLEYSTAELLAAVESRELTEAQTEGVARLFGGWLFSVRRPNDLGLLPAELKARLLKHSLTSADEDKRGRAQHAFGGK
jgi:hypothetical protein